MQSSAASTGRAPPAAGFLKISRAGLNIAAPKLFAIGAVLLTAHPIIRKVLCTMKPTWSALVMLGATAIFAPLGLQLPPAWAAAPIPEASGGAVTTLAPMLA